MRQRKPPSLGRSQPATGDTTTSRAELSLTVPAHSKDMAGNDERNPLAAAVAVVNTPAVVCPVCHTEHEIPSCIMWLIQCNPCGVTLYNLDCCPN